MDNNVNNNQNDQDNQNNEDKSNKTSPVWVYFSLVEVKNKFYAECTLNSCKDKISYHNSTTALLNHLKFAHPDAYEVCVSKKNKKSQSRQSTLISSHLKTQALSKERINNITLAIGRFISFDMRPINVIEGSGFQTLIHILEPRYEIPCRTVFTENIIPRLYESLKTEISKQFKSANSFGLTFDYWKSISLKSFLTLTIHFCSQDFDFHSYVLKTAEVTQSHTGQNTANVILSILEEFGLRSKPNIQFFTVSDGAANMELAGEELTFPHFNCFAHILHNSLKHCFEAPEIKRILKKAREIIKYFRASPARNEKLSSMQKKLNVPQIKLKLDVETRWNSVYDSLERLIQSQQAIINLGLEDNEVSGLMFSLDEWQEVIQIKNTLSPFKDITDILSSAQTPSISMLKPLIFIILKDILQIQPNDSDIAQTIKHLISEDFTQRLHNYGNVNNILLLASILDPRFKNLNYLEENEKGIAQKLLKEKFQELKQKEENLMKEEGKNENFKAEEKTKLVKLNKDSLGRLFKLSGASLQKPDLFKEVNQYFEIQELDIREDPLQWWKENSGRFKILSQIAKDILCIPVTSVPSERIFSKAGNIVSAKRSSLSSKLINSLIFLAENRPAN